MTQIPIYNVNNNCSTGSTGINMGRTMIAGGMADCVLVVGFEKMFPGSLQSFLYASLYSDAKSMLIEMTSNDRANPTVCSPIHPAVCQFETSTRDRQNQSRAQQEKSILAISRRVYFGADSELDYDSRASHEAAMLPYLGWWCIGGACLSSLLGCTTALERPSRSHRRPMPSHRCAVFVQP